MTKRRDSAAPLDRFEVLEKQVASLQRQIDQLRQPGPSTVQTMDHEYYLDPQQGEVMINDMGTHTDATPTSPFVYRHDGAWKSFGAIPGIEWMQASSPTDLGTTYTPIVWFGPVGPFQTSGNGYTDPGTTTQEFTFHRSAAGNIKIAKDGLYLFYVSQTGGVLNTVPDVKTFFRWRCIAGEAPRSLLNTFDSGGEFSERIRRIRNTSVNIDVTEYVHPMGQFICMYDNGTFLDGGAGPSEIEVSCYFEDDGTGVAQTTVTHYVTVLRIGYLYDAP